MRLLMLVHSLRRGGAERVLLEIALRLRAKGHEVAVVSWLEVDEYQEDRYRSVPRYFLIAAHDYRWPASIIRTAEALREVVRQFSPDVVEIHTPTVAWLAAWANISTPFIHVVHGYNEITRNPSPRGAVIRLVDRFVQKRLQANLIVLSKPMAERAASYLNAGRTFVVPNGVDLEKFAFKKKTPKGPPSILMLGTLCRGKGQHLGIEALKFLVRSIPSATLTLVGEGTNREALELLVGEHGLNNSVKILGRRDDVYEILSNTDVLWQLSESEGLPMAALEAMATGVPIVAFDVSGVRDVVVEGETGCLVPYGATEEVAQATRTVLDDRNNYQRLASNARRRVEQLFSLETMVAGHERVMTQSLTHRPA